MLVIFCCLQPPHDDITTPPSLLLFLRLRLLRLCCVRPHVPTSFPMLMSMFVFGVYSRCASVCALIVLSGVRSYAAMTHQSKSEV